MNNPHPKMEAAFDAMRDAVHSLERENAEMMEHLDRLRAHAQVLSIGIESIVWMALEEDTDEREPGEVVQAVLGRLKEAH